MRKQMMVLATAVLLTLALASCQTAKGLAHGWNIHEAHCYPNGSVDRDNGFFWTCG